jgi:hypothetical protein
VEQTASTALIAAIVAVVLAALGLVGGVIGYVQGTAALRRATLIRQRASAAEEAALQAKNQAEQAVRTAQQLVDRLNALQVRQIGDVADLPTGPLILPSRVPPSSAEPMRPEASGTRADRAPYRPPVRTGPVPVAAESVPAALPDPDPVIAPLSTATGPTPFITGPLPVVEPESTTAGPVPTGTGPVPRPDPSAPPPASTGSLPVAPRVESTATGSVPTPTGSPESAPAPVAAPRTGSSRVVAAPVEGAEPVADEQATAESEAVEEEPPTAARSATGQVTAGLQAAPPMDWQEALRTGAIPLPTVSRGTYAAPRKKSDRDPAAPIRFELRAVGRQSYEAVNLGGFTAEQAVVEGTGDDRHLVRPASSKPSAVEPGKALAFSVTRVEGRRISVRVTWLRPNGRPTSVELPLP